MIEVDLKLGVLMFVDGGVLQWALNTSTGGGHTYTDGGVTSVADTPTGTFRIFRQVDGLVVDSRASSGASTPGSPSTGTPTCRRRRSPTLACG